MFQAKLTRRDAIIKGGLALTAMALPIPLLSYSKFNHMTDNKNFDVIIIGGSYAGLSAAMALGRSLRNVLIIDSGLPCNKQTPHSHNFITQDGETPSNISEKAKEQVLAYTTVKFHNDIATAGMKTANGFTISTASEKEFTAKKLIFATGVKDNMPNIKGYKECWGTSIIHCPYCHGYEVRNENTGILANGDNAFHYAELISNWTNNLSIFTNGKSTLSQEQIDKINEHNIQIIEKEISLIKHDSGNIEQIVFQDDSVFNLKAIYSRPDFEQHCKIPENLGCEITAQGLVQVDMFQKTNVEGIFVCGDSASPLRAVSYAVATGGVAGMMLNNEMTKEEF